ncbi:MAG TPA: hypothetical protein VNR64_08540 [Vicinamibacterales bacterium]|nr:hypothetical protein [Vicinamibacterales bacterium]
MAATPPDALPPELRAFLHSCIESIEQIEMLMLLRGSERPRTTADIGAALRLRPATARRDLETLAARGLLEVQVSGEISYRYRPKSDELARYSDMLAEYYVTARQAVFGFVATEARLSMKRFADAFKLRDPEKP